MKKLAKLIDILKSKEMFFVQKLIRLSHKFLFLRGCHRSTSINPSSYWIIGDSSTCSSSTSICWSRFVSDYSLSSSSCGSSQTVGN